MPMKTFVGIPLDRFHNRLDEGSPTKVLAPSVPGCLAPKLLSGIMSNKIKDQGARRPGGVLAGIETHVRPKGKEGVGGLTHSPGPTGSHSKSRRVAMQAPKRPVTAPHRPFSPTPSSLRRMAAQAPATRLAHILGSKSMLIHWNSVTSQLDSRIIATTKGDRKSACDALPGRVDPRS